MRDRIGLDALVAPGGHQRRAGHPGLRPRGRRDRPLRRAATAASTDAHMRSVWIQAWYLPVIEGAGARHAPRWWSASAAGMVVDGTRHRRHRRLLRADAVEPVRAGAAAVASCSTRCSRPGAGLHKLFELLDTPVDVAERPGAVDLPGRRRPRGRGRVASPTATASPVLRDVDLVHRRRASGSPWSAPPAPASPRWPS